MFSLDYERYQVHSLLNPSGCCNGLSRIRRLIQQKFVLSGSWGRKSGLRSRRAATLPRLRAAPSCLLPPLGRPARRGLWPHRSGPCLCPHVASSSLSVCFLLIVEKKSHNLRPALLLRFYVGGSFHCPRIAVQQSSGSF